MENIDFEKIFSFIADILNAEPEENAHIKNFDSLVRAKLPDGSASFHS